MLQFHASVKDVLWQACKAAGHFAYKEQVVPQWGRWVLKRPRGRAGRTGDAERVFEEAILDLVSFDPSSLRHLYLDCTVRKSLGKRYLEAGSSDAPGVAMRLAVEQKA